MSVLKVEVFNVEATTKLSNDTIKPWPLTNTKIIINIPQIKAFGRAISSVYSFRNQANKLNFNGHVPRNRPKIDGTRKKRLRAPSLEIELRFILDFLFLNFLFETKIGFFRCCWQINTRNGNKIY